jgi:hypothetical protein
MYIQTREGLAGTPGPEGHHRSPMDEYHRTPMDEPERRWGRVYNEYVNDCRGVRLLSRLERNRLSPADRVRQFDRRLALIPRLFEIKRYIDARHRANPSDPAVPLLRRQLQEIIDREFGRGYWLSSEQQELARARCELSRARWELLVYTQHGTIPGRPLQR